MRVKGCGADHLPDQSFEERRRTIPRRLPISHETLRAFYEMDSIGDLGSLYVGSIDPTYSPLPAWTRAVISASAHEFLVDQLRHLAMAGRAVRHPRSEFTLFLDSTSWTSHFGLLLSCWQQHKDSICGGLRV